MRRRTGIAAAIFGALLPIKYSTEVVGDWEATFAGLGLVLLIYGFAVTFRRRQFTAARGLVLGLGCGLALLTAPALLAVFCAVAGLGALLVWRQSLRPYLKFVAAAALTATLCLAPWAWRNERQLGSPIFTRSNFGLEIRLSNNDLASPLELVNSSRGVYNVFHPLQSLQEAEAVRALGEVAYNRDRMAKGLLWIHTHPKRFLELTLERFLFTWFPWTGRPARDVLLWVLTLAAIAGLLVLWRSDRFSVLLLATCLVSYTSPFYLIHVNVRHRYPVDWIILICAAYCAVHTASEIRTYLRSRPRARADARNLLPPRRAASPGPVRALRRE